MVGNQDQEDGVLCLLNLKYQQNIPEELCYKQLEIGHRRLGERLGEENEIRACLFVQMDQLQACACKVRRGLFLTKFMSSVSCPQVQSGAYLQALQIGIPYSDATVCLALFAFEVWVMRQHIFEQDPDAFQVKGGGFQKLVIPQGKDMDRQFEEQVKACVNRSGSEPGRKQTSRTKGILGQP